MVETNNGLDDLRDFLAGHIDEIAVGTSQSQESKTDTSLGNELLRKSATSSVQGTGVVDHTMRVLTSEANGNDLAEVGEFDADPELQSRIVHSKLPKTLDFEAEYRVRKRITNK